MVPPAWYTHVIALVSFGSTTALSRNVALAALDFVRIYMERLPLRNRTVTHRWFYLYDAGVCTFSLVRSDPASPVTLCLLREPAQPLPTDDDRSSLVVILRSRNLRNNRLFCDVGRYKI